MSQEQHYNAFASRSKTPAVSFADKPPGYTITGRILEVPDLVQGRDYATGELATWPKGDPKLSVVTQLDVNGEQQALWAVKPSALCSAIEEALKQSGPGYPEVGGTLTITYTGDMPSEKPGKNPAKQFAAQYQPPNAFGSNGAQQQYAQQQMPQQMPQQVPQYAQQPAQQQWPQQPPAQQPVQQQQQQLEPPF